MQIVPGALEATAELIRIAGCVGTLANIAIPSWLSGGSEPFKSKSTVQPRQGRVAHCANFDGALPVGVVEHWLDVDDRRAIQRLEVAHAKPPTFDQDDLNAMQPDRVGAVR